jgi:predicted nucleotidyltransferase
MATAHPTLDWTVTEEKVWTALQRLIEASDPAKIIAFGSRAKGNAREDSDLDLAVILPADTVLRDTSLWAAVSGLNMTVDLIVTNEDLHERLGRSINSVHYDIDHEGMVLYEKGAHGTPRRAAVEKLVAGRGDDAA